MKRFIITITILALFPISLLAADQTLSVTSPDGKIVATITIGATLTYAIDYNGNQVLAPSKVALRLTDGTTWGENCKLVKSSTKTINNVIPTPFTRQAEMNDHCNELLLTFKDHDVIFRAYDNGVAYRFVSHRKKAFNIEKEIVEYCFNNDYEVTTPYVLGYEEGKTTLQDQFFSAFENLYTTAKLSALNPKRLSFLPLTIDLGENGRMCITETALENYPGLYLVAASKETTLCGVNAPFPKKTHQGGYKNLEVLVDEIEPFIAKVSGERAFPWRIAMLGKEDIDIANNNLSYILASPSRITDISWIKPGKVAWDWWNDWNISHVDFVAGRNNDTYKYYIDFAAQNGIEYVILDEGWSVDGEADLMQIIPDINLQEIIDYATKHGVGIILWAGYYSLDRDMENLVSHYADMGVKGFKIDFMDRDDQLVSDFYYRAAETCARYKLVCDFHGAFKPAGLDITYPNVLNFEGVSGLEQMKWEPATRDQMQYDCQLPYIRQAAGPMDYTQGAMRNTAKGEYVPNYSNPMSQGTRAHQLALYIVLESPLCMLCDSPTAYLAEQECTSLISAIPTTWDFTKVLCGTLGQYIVTARRKGSTWYIGGITNWDARDIVFTLPSEIDLSLSADLFKDGVNADKQASDYKRETISLERQMKIHLAQGGGFIMKIEGK